MDWDLYNKYGEIFKQFWGEDYDDVKNETTTSKMIDMKRVNEKVVKLLHKTTEKQDRVIES